jgi:mannose-6-phosphate isomerase-like protein (cupin superfamily)
MKNLIAITLTVMLASVALSEPKAVAPVTYIDSEKVSAALAKGMPLIETPGYKVLAGRREHPGLVELHTQETDVFYILDGTATFVTGGTMVDGKVISPGQMRGTSITGGEAHHLKKGDVIVVPNGTPHQFIETSNPFLYFIVKPISN